MTASVTLNERQLIVAVACHAATSLGMFGEFDAKLWFNDTNGNVVKIESVKVELALKHDKAVTAS